MSFKLGENEKVVWKCETDGETWSVWPIIDDGDPITDDELTDRTFEYRQSIGIKRVTDKTNRFDITRDSEEKNRRLAQGARNSPYFRSHTRPGKPVRRNLSGKPCTAWYNQFSKENL